MVGVGAPKVEVKLAKSEAVIHEAVKGVVTISGGEYETKIDRILLYMLTVEELKEKNDTKESTNKVGTITFNDYNLVPGESISVPFQIVIPKNNLITSSSIKHYVKVSLDIPGKDVFGVCEITIK